MRTAHALLAWCACACVGASTFENNGYDDIQVSLPDDVPDDERQDLLDDLQKLFVTSSRVLYVATKRRAHFRGATLLLPPSWGGWGGNATYRHGGGGEEAAEVALVARQQGAAELPWALHHRGCGCAARRMLLPRGFLENGSMSWEEKGVPFVRAWAEFRYGVFPEGGFFSDDRFPPYRVLPGAPTQPLLRVTACADPAPQFLNRTQSGEECDPDTSEPGLCMPYPDLDRMDRPPTSSLAYQQMGAHAPLFCEGVLNLGPRHDPRGPSKHNLVCEEESVWHVILRSPDFVRGRNAATKYEPPPFTMRFVQQRTAPTIVVAVDVSSRMREQYAWARNGLARWISSDLPDGSRIALLSFAGSVQLLSGFVELSAPRSRSELLESDPLPEETVEGERACVECALLEAVELLETYPETDTGGTVVVLTSTAELNVSSLPLSGRLSRSGIRLQAVLFGQTSGSGDNQAPGALVSLCADSGGALVALPDDGGPDLLYRIMAGFLREYDSVIAQEWLTPSNPTLRFYLDEGSTDDVRVILGDPGFDPFDPPLIAGQTTLSDGDATYTAFQRLEFATAWRFALPSPKAGEFVLETRWREKAGDVPVLATVQARPDSAGAIRARLWFDHVDIRVDPFAVLVFVEVRSGSFPVAGAAVSVSVRHPGSDRVSSFDLLDDGNTTPDMTEGDGIYSRTFSNISDSGFYTLTAEVTGDNFTFILPGPASDCCGSRFPHAEASRRSTGPFRRLLGPVSLATPQAPPPGDVHPPGRVADLGVRGSYGRVFVVTWSATGGDHENGHAAKYELKLSSDRTQLRRNFDSLSPSTVIESPDSVPYGTTLFHTCLVADHVGRGIHFFGMRAVDGSGNAGPVSNTVEVWVEGSGKEEPVRCGNGEDEPKQEEYNSAGPAVSSSAEYLLCVLVVFVFCSRVL